jgi:CBS domain-containing protein
MDKIKHTTPETGLWSALKQMDRTGVNQLPVTENSHIVGMLTREDVISFLQTLQEFGA